MRHLKLLRVLAALLPGSLLHRGGLRLGLPGLAKVARFPATLAGNPEALVASSCMAAHQGGCQGDG